MLEKWKRYCGGSSLLAWLILIEAGVWVAVTILALAGKLLKFNTGIAEWMTLPSQFSLFITRPWTLVSYIAIHFDVLHMLFNVLWLYWFGIIMITTLRDRHLALSFFGGGICGGILFLISAALGYGTGWLCGCSAAVIAVMTVTAIKLPDHKINLFLIGEVKLKWVAIACCILTFLGGGGNQAAHIGGLIWGITIGVMIRKGIDPTVFRYRQPAISHYVDKRRSSDRMVKVLQDRRNDMERLDELLDKIKLSGYESLSHKERKELNELSKRIK